MLFCWHQALETFCSYIKAHKILFIDIFQKMPYGPYSQIYAHIFMSNWVNYITESFNIGYRYSAGIKKKSVFLISARKRQVLNCLFHAETA